jgi:hypothetical protein
MKLLLLVFSFVFTIAEAQQASVSDLYELNNGLAIANFHISNNKPECALKTIKAIRPEILKLVTSTDIANVYMLNRDSTSTANELLRIYLNPRHYRSISEISKIGSRFNFVYKRNKRLFDSIYLTNDFAYHNNLECKGLSTKLDMMLGEEQLIRNDKFIHDNLKCISIEYIDSIHIGKLLEILQKDTQCITPFINYGSLYAHMIHLTRYDTVSFDFIIDYCKRCFESQMKSELIAMLTDSRLYVLSHEEKYYNYLFKWIEKNNLNFAEIDKNRREIGLESLFFSYINNKITIPDYYKEFNEKLLKCN